MGFIGSYGGASITIDVTGGVSISPIPATAIAPQSEYFLNGSAYDMNVNGSVTPQYFDVAPPSDETWYCEHVTFGIDDGGGCPATAYGAIAGGLTNGCELTLIKNSVEYPIRNLKKNGDLSLSFNFSVGFFENGKFLAMANGFFGKMVFATNIGLKGADGDKLRFKVNDDLTGLLFQRMACQIWKRIT